MSDAASACDSASEPVAPRRRGFSMIEFSAALAIAGLISAAAVSAFALLNRKLVIVGASTRADDVAKTLVGHFIPELQGVGGAALRPWDSVVIEAAPAAARDVVPASTSLARLWYASALTGTVDCPIVAQTATTITSTDACCLGNYIPTKKNGGPDYCPRLPSSTDALLVNGETRLNRTVVSADFDDVAHTCTLNTTAGPLAFADRGSDDSVVGGLLTLTELRVVFVDESTHVMQQLSDIDKDGVYGADEAVALADAIFAFDIRLGWDINDQHGVEDTEWTRSNDPPGTGARASLRQLELTLVAGAKVKDPGLANTVMVSGLPMQVANHRLVTSTSRALFRNLFVFLN